MLELRGIGMRAILSSDVGAYVHGELEPPHQGAHACRDEEA